MLALEIVVNGSHTKRVGLETDGLVQLHISLSSGRFVLPVPDATPGITSARLTLAGIRHRDGSTEQLRWGDFKLQRGDMVEVAIVNLDEVDQPEVVSLPDKARRTELAHAQIVQLRKQLRELEEMYPDA